MCSQPLLRYSRETSLTCNRQITPLQKCNSVFTNHSIRNVINHQIPFGLYMRFHAQPIKLEHFLLLFPSGHNCHCVQNVSGPMQTPWEKERPPLEHAHALGRSSPRGQAPQVVWGRMREQWSGGPSTPVRVQEERVAWSGLCGHSLNTGEG